MPSKMCNKCGKCCKGSMGTFVFPSDVLKISNMLNVDKKYFLNKFCVKNTLDIYGKKVDIFSIKTDGGVCMFLKNNLCDIYQYRPYQCIYAPYDFLSQSGFWEHMPCLDRALLKNSDSTYNDSIMFRELLDRGYND